MGLLVRRGAGPGSTRQLGRCRSRTFSEDSRTQGAAVDILVQWELGSISH